MTLHIDIPEYSIVDGKKRVNFPRGAKRVHRIPIKDADGNPQTMTSWTFAYVWRNASGDVAFAQKISGSGISLTNGVTAEEGIGTDNVAVVTINRVDTLALGDKQFSGALWRTDGTDDDPLATFTLVLSHVADQ